MISPVYRVITTRDLMEWNQIQKWKERQGGNGEEGGEGIYSRHSSFHPKREVVRS